MEQFQKYKPCFNNVYEERNSLYRSPNTDLMSRRLRWAGHVARMLGKSAFKMLTGRPVRKRPIGRPGRR